MTSVTDFQQILISKDKASYAKWHTVDLHNHSPKSFDYLGNKDTAIEDTAAKINTAGLSIVMFTDHGELPSKEFADGVASKTSALILRGVELNVFADAFGKPDGKIDKEAFFHLLIGFDPENEMDADFWLQTLYFQCGIEDKNIGGQNIKGITNNLEKIIEVLAKSNAIIIPAHLHSNNNVFKSRSIDDIYSDNRFLQFVNNFTALEVTDPRTSNFFDGKHSQTKNAEISCIQSSDAHLAERLGERPTWVLMQKPSFNELKASLGMRSRVSLVQPATPSCYVIGLNIEGNYLKDFWLSLSPNCNVFIGIKGSGKTAALECLRFTLGVEVPKNSVESVNSHLMHILGSTGRVRCLVRREDGSDVLIERSMSNRDQFQVTFSDGRIEIFTQVEALRFPAQILGWHEIEHAATDSSVRRKYLDGIAGQENITRIEEHTKRLAEQVKYLHEQAASQYKTFRALHDQVTAQEELRRGLQELQDNHLIDLRNEYDSAIAHRTEIQRLHQLLPNSRQSLLEKTRGLLLFKNPILAGISPLEVQALEIRNRLNLVLSFIDEFATELDSKLQEEQTAFELINVDVEQAFSEFSKRFENAVAELSVEKRNLLDSHRQVMEQTRDLTNLQAQRESAKQAIQKLLTELISYCSQITSSIEERSNIRKNKLAAFGDSISDSGVKLELLVLQNTDYYSDYSNRYREGFIVYQAIQASHSSEMTLHQRLRKAYEALLDDLVNGYRLFFNSAEFSHYLTVFENDDLAISFDPYGNGSGHRPIDQLSAGQRCTAMFPLLLKLKQGPLVIDQPEDNLDNRHIASKISPAIVDNKPLRQIIMTSHNANLLVLSDPENVVVFEGNGSNGLKVSQGFLATRESEVTKHVLDILDGGERALEMRYAKYGANK